MRCPFCSAEETKVVDSRFADDGESVRRRRECLACHERFTTYERAELRLPQIIKSDDRREAFSEQKLRAAIQGVHIAKAVQTSSPGIARDVRYAAGGPRRFELD